MPSYVLRLYRESDPAIHPGDFLGQVEIEAEDVWKAEAKVHGLQATFPSAVNFGVLHDESDEPFIPLDFRHA